MFALYNNRFVWTAITVQVGFTVTITLVKEMNHDLSVTLVRY